MRVRVVGSIWNAGPATTCVFLLSNSRLVEVMFSAQQSKCSFDCESLESRRLRVEVECRSLAALSFAHISSCYHILRNIHTGIQSTVRYDAIWSRQYVGPLSRYETLHLIIFPSGDESYPQQGDYRSITQVVAYINHYNRSRRRKQLKRTKMTRPLKPSRQPVW